MWFGAVDYFVLVNVTLRRTGNKERWNTVVACFENPREGELSGLSNDTSGVSAVRDDVRVSARSEGSRSGKVNAQADVFAGQPYIHLSVISMLFS